MFTADQLKTAHSKVKSGADFPAYIKEISGMGVLSYETFVTNGRTVFYGENNFSAEWPAKYSALLTAEQSDKQVFEKDLRDHQQGKSDYPTFCKQSADSGVEKWVVDIQQMTCTYYDKAGNEMLKENIPS